MNTASKEDKSMWLRPLNWPQMSVQITVSPDQMTRLYSRVEECFSKVDYPAPFRDDQLKDFFDVGRGQIYSLDMAVERCGLSLENVHTCVEIGCGHGRATIPLAERFPQVIAVDVSAPHLKAAQGNAKRAGQTNIEFIHGNGQDWINKIGEIDLFFSKFALQHSAPPIMYFVLNSILGKVRRGGIAYFQVSVYGLGYNFDAETYLASPINLAVPEMHMLPQHEVFALMDKHDFQILEVREDPSAGLDCISLHILSHRKEKPV
jgi:SAM-dependent methyltransferase